MTRDTLSNLAEWEWLCSAEGRSLLDSLTLQFNSESEMQLMRAARAVLPQARASLIVEQIRLRQRAAKKFSQPEKWIWTPLLLEQATDEFTAQFVAGFYPAHHSVIDLCCGAGSDAVALARGNRPLVAVDSWSVAVCIAKSNLDAHGLTGTVNCGMAENFSIPENSWVQCDPDRRPTGKRVTNLESLCPSQPALEHMIRQSIAGSIKLAPATEPPEAWRSAYGMQWISSERSVRQLRIWWGAEAFGPGTRSASVRDHQGVWHTLQRSAQAYDRRLSSVPYTDECEAWIGDYDSAVRTAELTCCLAEEVQASIIETDTGYLTAPKPQAHAMVTWFRVVDVLSADMKKLRAYFRQNNVGVLEIKQRGTGFDLEKIRRELKLQGEAKRTLFYFRAKGTVRAVIAERVP